MSFQLAVLPYGYDALQPHISKETLEYHHGKHHATYVSNLNNLTLNTGSENSSLEDLIRKSSGAIFNNAAQVWNHTFYWNCMTPEKKELTGELKETINKCFGSAENFKKEFTDTALKVFGSGWCWLVKKQNGSLGIVGMTGAGNPLKEGMTPVLVCDVWEHAYYIDYRNLRASYIKSFWNVINWDFVAEQLKGETFKV